MESTRDGAGGGVVRGPHDRIDLTGIRAFGRHGVFDSERRQGQEFVVDLRLRADLAEAQRSDRLEDTVDYGALANRVAEIVGGEPYDLIEALAGRIADDLADDPRLWGVEVTVHKPSAPIEVPFGDVAVTVSRERVS